jgi:hypothetical protein
MGAGEAGQIPEDRELRALLVRRLEHGKSHGAAAGFALMRVDALNAAVTFDQRFGFHETLPEK